jgi:hypothetical protein
MINFQKIYLIISHFVRDIHGFSEKIVKKGNAKPNGTFLKVKTNESYPVIESKV